MEILQRLPLELERKIYLYLEHPVAELFKKQIGPGKKYIPTKAVVKLLDLYPHLWFSTANKIFVYRKNQVFVDVTEDGLVASLA